MNFFKKIKKSFINRKNDFGSVIRNLFFKNQINDDFFVKLEEKLLVFDFGFHTTQKIVESLLVKYKQNRFLKEIDVYLELKKYLLHILSINKKNSFNNIKNNLNTLQTILFVGVNGVGKTTSAVKLARLYIQMGKKVLLSASDTFRFAAIEQLQFWGKKNSIPVFAKKIGFDSSAVIFDSIDFAKKNCFDILIIDTAGRLHNKVNLMEELKKNIRVINNKNSGSINDIYLVLDMCSGQNTILQTKLFSEKLINITGIILTKLDGTAKGGVIFPILEKFLIPIQYISHGEHIDDFSVFNEKKFIDNMFA
ncbi:signal recognition particle-docking protein FtsY [Buchnera aphidicola]|uniref:signal recognition particle-docking protein FtsY n=1 Tax=Buchnera aphidicola TaxID=9 RepID=UPI0031B80A0C